MHTQHHNWIDGALCAAVSGETFDVRSAGTRDSLGRWPRSGARDLDVALRAHDRDAVRWSATPADTRRQILSSAIDDLLDDAVGEEHVARAIGLELAELDAFLEPLEWALDDVLEGRARPSAEFASARQPGATVLALEWSEMWLAPARLAFEALAAGRSVITVSDARCPALADALRRALCHLPRGVFQVVHDDGRSVLRAALEDERVSSVHLPSTAEAETELIERDTTPRSVTAHSGFGAGVELQRAPKLRVRALESRSFVVRSDADMHEQAAYVRDHAFGRVAALSGGRPGRIGRALVPKRVFSSFTSALLEALAADSDALTPLSLARSVLAAHVERAFALGHDEGATAIFTGPARAPVQFPLVFTNVEERMRLARLNRPCPVLSLMRVGDEALGRALASRLDARFDA